MWTISHIVNLVDCFYEFQMYIYDIWQTTLTLTEKFIQSYINGGGVIGIYLILIKILAQSQC